jgi:porphobilinogen synthase
MNPVFREMVRETRLSVKDLIFPLFAVQGDNIKQEIREIPGSWYLSGKALADEARAIRDLGIPAVLVFGIPEESLKDEQASPAFDPDGSIQQAVRILRKAAPELVIMTDCCLCEFTIHGHCGVLERGRIDNDRTLELIARSALSHAEAGAMAIAPSGVMDGAVTAIRRILDDHGFSETMVVPYSIKAASVLYGPFKTVTNSVPGISLHSTHQIDPANAREALRQAARDVAEGADMLIIKPALSNLDLIARIAQQTSVPLVAYQVSGEYTMARLAAEKFAGAADSVIWEMLTCIKRAGADLIISYFAKKAAEVLNRTPQFD